MPAGNASGTAALGSAVVNGAGTALTGQGYFAASSLTGGGFDSLTLPGTVRAYTTGALYARASGYITSWAHDIGAHVKGHPAPSYSTR